MTAESLSTIFIPMLRRELLLGTVVTGTEAALIGVATACGLRTSTQTTSSETPVPKNASTAVPTAISLRPVETNEWFQIYVGDTFEHHFYAESYHWNKDFPNYLYALNAYLKGPDEIYRGPIARISVVTGSNFLGVTPEPIKARFTPEKLIEAMKIKGDRKDSFKAKFLAYTLDAGKILRREFLLEDTGDPLTVSTTIDAWVQINNAWQVMTNPNHTQFAERIGSKMFRMPIGPVKRGDIGYVYIQQETLAFPNT